VLDSAVPSCSNAQIATSGSLTISREMVVFGLDCRRADSKMEGYPTLLFRKHSFDEMLEATLASDGSTSSDLLSRVRQHDPAAWSRFVTLYAPLVYTWCRKAGIKPADAGDILQDVFARAFAAIDRFRHDREGDTLRGWLRVICRNQVTDHFRRQGGAPAAVGGTDAQAKMAAVPAWADDEAALVDDRERLVRRAAELVRSEFEPRTWQAFWAMAVEGRSAAETATALGMTPGAVRQAKYIVTKRLREELSGEFDIPSAPV
jgi:RNA polymerase sigma-70 factor, ECF subfamily